MVVKRKGDKTTALLKLADDSFPHFSSRNNEELFKQLLDPDGDLDAQQFLELSFKSTLNFKLLW